MSKILETEQNLNLKKFFIVVAIVLFVMVGFVIFCYFSAQEKTGPYTPIPSEPTGVSALEDLATERGEKYIVPEPTNTLPLREILSEKEHSMPKPTGVPPLE